MFKMSSTGTNMSTQECWWRSTVVRTSVYDRQTFPGLCHDVLLTGDLLSHSSSWGWPMSSKLNLGILYPHMRRGAAWGMLTGKADMVLLAGDTVRSISESIRCVSKDVLYKLTWPLPLAIGQLWHQSVTAPSRTTQSLDVSQLIDVVTVISHFCPV